jgi:gallate decarboxylase subunit C
MTLLCPGQSLRQALRARGPAAQRGVRRHVEPIERGAIAEHYASRFAGIPASASAGREEPVLYTSVTGSKLPVLMGVYGDERRIRHWLPGLPQRTTLDSAVQLLQGTRPPLHTTRAAAQQIFCDCDLAGLPTLRTGPLDAGEFITMGIALAGDPASGDAALSVHRMLVLDRKRITLSMIPGRQLRALHEQALERGERLPLTINIGAPPAAMLASALGSRFLPRSISKLGVAGALAGAAIQVATARSQPALVLADSEIVIEGYLATEQHDERVPGAAASGLSLPEFLGYHGEAKISLPVLTVTAISRRRGAMYEAVIGPGREQSHILGLAHSLSVALSLGVEPSAAIVRDLHFPPAGGGSLLLVVQVRKTSAQHDASPGSLARTLLQMHPLLKWIVFVDDDIDPRSAEDVLWAITTRANLSSDVTSLGGFAPMRMDPSQTPAWSAARGRDGAEQRSFLDATVPYALRASIRRSFGLAPEART